VIQDVRVVVVVPAFDEAPRISRVLASMPAGVDHVVVVDDASTDGTAAAAARSLDPRVEVVRHADNRGVGAAITTGYLRAQVIAPEPRSAFVVMAGDGQMHPDDLPTLIRPIAEGWADYVKGCRFDWPDASLRMPRARRLGGYAFSIATSLAIGQRVRDSQCGYTALSCEASKAIDLERVWHGYGYPNDLLGLVAAAGLRITEVPVRPVYADEGSRLRLRHLPVIAGIVGRAYARRLARGL
jgi:glycosyltransferase involved in cell wall biosynthesis